MKQNVAVVREALDFINGELASERLMAKAVESSPEALAIFRSRIHRFSMAADLLEEILEDITAPALENLNGTIGCCPRCRH